jgi:hypothetical protein
VLNIKAVLRTIAAERAIFLIVNIVFSFVMSRGGCAQHDEKLETRSMAPVFSHSRIPIPDWRVRPEFRGIAALCMDPTG